MLPRKANSVRRFGVNKRTVTVSVTMSEENLKKLTAAAEKLWPGAPLSRSSMVLAMALRGAEAVLNHGQNRKR